MKKIILVALFSILVIACKQSQKNTEEKQVNTNKPEAQIPNTSPTIYGNYVDNSYAKKAEGYDWVAVSVKPIGDNSISISVRSRADKKKPTCTFDTKAYQKNEHSYEAVYDGKTISFDFTEDSISISTGNTEDSGILNFFCSGGATIGGTYKKISEDLDARQVDQTSFTKLLNLQNIGFNISSIKKNGKNTLTVFAFGLTEQDYNETFDIAGEQVIDAEVEDLNADGSPDLFVYTQSIDGDKYGNVYAFSVNNKKSMSQVYFQPTADNTKINKGYKGHDEFSIVETVLVQQFPVYKEGDTNAKPTGGTRQVSYKLVDGEASRKLEVSNTSSMP
ncbi:hypothetical protein [Aestuariivivens insulae]|uniref:hypothetical protein n=1 Tax=Aestuariivivens insulae TaxID=1621988 RepID=UPI001F5A4426|nr:hypothetical protein [Aestuariivivens insulae]